MHELHFISWRFVGGSEMIDKSVDPPLSICEEVRLARELLFRPYPRILPNIPDQYCRTAQEFARIHQRAWINVPLRGCGMRMLALYFVYRQSRRFWNGFELVYEPTEENQRAVSNLLEYNPEQLWHFCISLQTGKRSEVSVATVEGASWDGCPAACHFLFPDKFYSGPVPADWENFVRPRQNKPNVDAQKTVQQEGELQENQMQDRILQSVKHAKGALSEYRKVFSKCVEEVLSRRKEERKHKIES